jgi:hypothetical protein
MNRIFITQPRWASYPESACMPSEKGLLPQRD